MIWTFIDTPDPQQNNGPRLRQSACQAAIARDMSRTGIGDLLRQKAAWYQQLCRKTRRSYKIFVKQRDISIACTRKDEGLI